MNIMFYYESLNLGGQQTQNYNLIKRLKKQGHDLHHTYLYGDVLTEKMAEYAKIQQFPMILGPREYLRKPWKVWSIVSKLVKYGKSNKIDLIISGSGLGSLMSGIAARILGIKHYRLIGCSLVQVERTLYKIYRWIRIDSVIDGYFGWPGVFAELEQKGVPLTKCHELTNAVDSDVFFPIDEDQKAQWRNKLDIKDELVIGWIGRIATNMQVGNTVALGKELLDRGFKDFKMLLVGGGEWYEGIQDLIRDHGLTDHVVLTNWVPMEDVNSYINIMDIVPLLEEDPHGGSIVREAMAVGKVALSVDGSSGSQARFMSGEHAVLVAPDDFLRKAADEVLKLANDKNQMNIIGEHARRYAQKHMSFDTQVDIILDTVRANGLA
jgi:glycosyltransferase involved in cell wall biosynthesis